MESLCDQAGLGKLSRDRALRAGASGFLLKDAPPRDLLHAIDVIAAGEALIAPKITSRLIAEFAARRDPAQPPPALAELTDRERDILRLVARGLSNDEIAGELIISPLTAKTHVSNILRNSTAATAPASSRSPTRPDSSPPAPTPKPRTGGKRCR